MFPGRFSFFFGTGILKLSPAANDLKKKKKIPRRIFGTVGGRKKMQFMVKNDE